MATAEKQSMTIVWVVAAALVILGVVLAMMDAPAVKPASTAAPQPAAEKPMAKEEAKPDAAAPAESTEKKPQ